MISMPQFGKSHHHLIFATCTPTPHGIAWKLSSDMIFTSICNMKITSQHPTQKSITFLLQQAWQTGHIKS